MYKYNNQGNTGNIDTNWNSARGSSGQKLSNIPPIRSTVNGKVRYYSSIDAELYFGDIFIDDITNIAWSVQQQSLPIYGYNSYTFDDIAVGSRIIQGQFAVNFTQKNFLTALQKDNDFKKISRRTYGEDNPINNSSKSQLKKPMWDSGFDIVICLGETKAEAISNNNNAYGTYLILTCVQLTSSSIQLDYNGDPIQEMYSFIAKDIKETLSDVSTNETNTSTTASTTATNKTITLVGEIDLTKSSNHVTISSKEEVTFSKGILQISSDDIVTSVYNLTPTNKTQLITSLDKDFITKFKKQYKTSQKAIAEISAKYTKGADSSEINYNNKIEFSVKI